MAKSLLLCTVLLSLVCVAFTQAPVEPPTDAPVATPVDPPAAVSPDAPVEPPAEPPIEPPVEPSIEPPLFNCCRSASDCSTTDINYCYYYCNNMIANCIGTGKKNHPKHVVWSLWKNFSHRTTNLTVAFHNTFSLFSNSPPFFFCTINNRKSANDQIQQFGLGWDDEIPLLALSSSSRNRLFKHTLTIKASCFAEMSKFLAAFALPAL